MSALENIRILDHTTGDELFPPILISNCKGVFLRDVVIKGSNFSGPALSVVDSDDVLIDGFTLSGSIDAITSGVDYSITGDQSFSGLRISHVSIPRVKDCAIILESNGAGGKLSNYLISENLGDVADRIHGANALIANNIPSRANINPDDNGLASKTSKAQP